MKTQWLHLGEDTELILSTRRADLKAWYWLGSKTATDVKI